MQILITGGTGFIGQGLVKQWLTRGWSLTVLTRNVSKWQQTLPQVRWFSHWDELAKDENWDAIINLAGEPILDKRWTEQRKASLLASRVGVTQHLYQYVTSLAYMPKRLISGSAIGYYGFHPPEVELTEDSQPGQDFAAQLCVAWEQAADEIRQLGIATCCVRTGVVLGHGGALQKMLPPFKLGLGGPIGTGKQIFSWIHYDDMLACIDWLLQNPNICGVINATAPQPVSNAEFAMQLGKVLHRPAFCRVPATALELLLGREASAMLLQGQRVLPKRLLEEGFTFKYPDIASTLSHLLAQH